MSLVARGLGLTPTALVGPSVWGFTLKIATPPPVVTTVDPYAKKHANTQVIRESHLKKWLKKHQRKDKRREVQRVDLEPVVLAPLRVLAKPFGPTDARHIERAARLIARIATDQNFVLSTEDLRVLEETPHVLKKIH